MLSRNVILGLLLFFVVVSSLTYVYRTPTGDDAWFAEQSYLFLKEGVIRSEFFRGLNGWHQELLVSHKLFIWIGSLYLAIGGISPLTFQLLGYVSFMVLIGLIIYAVYKEEKTSSSYYILLILLLLFSNRLLIKMSFQNRPEILLACLGFASFLLLASSNKSFWTNSLAGMLAGLALVLHLNGAIYLIGGGITLLYIRDLRCLLYFTIGGILAASIYWIDIIDLEQGMSVWYYQFKNDPAAKSGFSMGEKLIQLLTYPRMFLHSPEQFSLSLLFVYLVYRQRAYFAAVPKLLRVYLPVIVVGFGLLTKSNTAFYMLLFVPFMLLMMYYLYSYRPFVTKMLIGLFVAYLIIGLVGMGQLVVDNYQNRNLITDYKRLTQIIGNTDKGVVPLTFFFNEYTNYESLLTQENFKLQSNKDKSKNAIDFARWALKNNASFLLLDHKLRPEYFYPKAGTKMIGAYYLCYFDGRFAVYKRREK